MANQIWLMTSFPRINTGEITEARGCTDSSSNIKTEKNPRWAKGSHESGRSSIAWVNGRTGWGEAFKFALVFPPHCHERWQNLATAACSYGTVSDNPKPSGAGAKIYQGGWLTPGHWFLYLFSPSNFQDQKTTKRKLAGKGNKIQEKYLKPCRKSLLSPKGDTWMKAYLSLEKLDAKI